ncbi:hypothetical protein AO377_0969 [Moraxella catarrhalis]|nr:hypothetical protein AO377_0969 [Moraxella catarrhalis]
MMSVVILLLAVMVQLYQLKYVSTRNHWHITRIKCNTYYWRKISKNYQ